MGKAGTSGTVSHCLKLVPSSMPGMIRERERRVNSRENEKDDRKLALVGRVVAKERKIEKQQNRDKMDKARTCAKPVRLSATSNLHVLSSMSGKEKERDTEGWGKGQESG